MRVVILPTGRTEWHGFDKALKELFPGNEFTPIPTPTEIKSHPDSFPTPGFTSNRLTERQRANPPEDVKALLERASREALGDRFTEAADLVLILDDVEVANLGNERMIVDVARAAVQGHLAGLSSRVREKTAEALRTRVSFHLLRPMIEGWFFGDPGAIRRTGAQPPFVLNSDPEHFEVRDDMAYLQANEAECPEWVAAGRKRKLKPKWIGNPHRHLHPKGYIQWLTREGQEKSCSLYSETEHGAVALAGLNWAAVLSRPADQFQYLRALVADLADALDQVPATGPVEGVRAPLTDRFTLPPDPVLRNL
jgi:hypothetical protein